MPTKVHIVKAILFPVVMYGCESWTIKKAEGWRIDAFELWCWRRLLRVPWTTRRSNQSILKEISPECSLEGLMLKLKLQYLAIWCEELTHWKRPWCWERLKAGGKGDDRGYDGWIASPTQWTWIWVNSRSWRWTRRLGVVWSMGSQSQTWLSEWTELKEKQFYFFLCNLYIWFIWYIYFSPLTFWLESLVRSWIGVVRPDIPVSEFIRKPFSVIKYDVSYRHFAGFISIKNLL